MQRTVRLLAMLAGGTALTTVGQPAFGQEAAAGPGAGAQEAAGEIVVTATRQGELALSRVPMSITAETQESLDQRAIKVASDLERIVPALRIDDVGAEASNISIRGVRSEVGSATTGIYIDDTALQTRPLRGTTGGGVFLPPLFDLERVEVLKGPQGTLYGGSSQGGTVRFITPEPSLSGMEVYGRTEINKVEYGDFGYEAGVAIGMPIVEGTLGMRASGFFRRFGGYIDYVDRRNPDETIAKDDNWRTQQAARIALAWEPNEKLRITPSYYFARDNLNGLNTVYRDTPAFTTPAFGTLQGSTRASPIFGPYTGQGNSGGILPDGYTPPPGGGLVDDIPGLEGTLVYIHPEHTYPALDLGPYDSIEVTNAGDDYTGRVEREPSQRENTMHLAGLSVDLELGDLQLTAITSYLSDASDGVFNASYISSVNVTSISGYDPRVNTPYLFDTPNPITSAFFFDTEREAISEEIRLTYPENDWGLSFVAGIFFNDASTYSLGTNIADRSSPREAAFNIPQFYWPIHTAEQIASQNQQTQEQTLDEQSAALFGEANYQLTDDVRLTVGGRISREEIEYSLRTWGLLYNTEFGVGTFLEGGTTEYPFTPKVSVSWQATPDDLLYLTASKGYRPGGAQGQASTVICGADLQALGIENTPVTYGSDTVWNFEAGAKLRPFDALRISGSAFYIDWNTPQTPYALPTCNFQYVTNIGHAVSKGFDLQGVLTLAPGFTLDFAVGYTDARFTEDVFTEPNANGDRALLVSDGMELVGVPKWSGSVGARYDFVVSNDWDAYVFGSYQYTGEYKNTLGPGVLSYAPDVYIGPDLHNALLRAGVTNGTYEVSVFVDNLLADKTLRPNNLNGRQSCRNEDCSLYGSFFPLSYGSTLRPRTFGLSATVRY